MFAGNYPFALVNGFPYSEAIMRTRLRLNDGREVTHDTSGYDLPPAIRIPMFDRMERCDETCGGCSATGEHPTFGAYTLYLTGEVGADGAPIYGEAQ